MKKIKYFLWLLAVSTLSINGFSQKKWSPQAKDGVIGAGAGAVIGAVVSKHNRGSGALIGGAIGGGAGYLYGRHRAHEKRENAIAAEQRNAAYRQGREQAFTASHRKNNYNTYTAPSERTTLMSSGSSAAYGDVGDGVGENYFQSASYGFQRRSW